MAGSKVKRPEALLKSYCFRPKLAVSKTTGTPLLGHALGSLPLSFPPSMA